MCTPGKAPARILFENELDRVLVLPYANDLVMPTYFPAVSGTGTNWNPIDLIRLVIASSYPRLLASAHDLASLAPQNAHLLKRLLDQYRRKGGMILLDSGLFESKWKGDETWNFSGFARVIRRFPADFYCSFDKPTRTSSRVNFRWNYGKRALQESLELRSETACFLIARGPTSKQLLESVRSIIANSPTPLRAIAIPERECGPNLLERTGTVAKVRSLLDSVSKGTILHVLRCGFPLTAGVYTYAGANSFDSQDWSQLAINRKTFGITDPAHLILTGCTCAICSKIKFDNYEKTMLHNLLFYQEFFIQLQRMIKERTLADFLLAHVGEPYFAEIREAIDRNRSAATGDSHRGGGS